MKKIKFIFILFSVNILTACSLNDVMDTLMDDKITSYSDQMINLILEKDSDAFYVELHADVTQKANLEAVSNIFSQLPNDTPISSELIDYRFTSFAGTDGNRTDHSIEYQYQFSETWMHIKLDIREENKTYQVYGFYFTPMARSIQEINKFDITEATPIELIILTLMIIFPAFMFYTFYVVFKLRKQLVKRKRWMFFVLLGFGGIIYNWTTKFMGLKLFTVGLFGAGFYAPGLYGPVTLSLYFPIGAALFWFFKKRGTLSMVEDVNNDELVTQKIDDE